MYIYIHSPEGLLGKPVQFLINVILIRSISQSQSLGFSCTTICRVHKEWCEKGKKHPVFGSHMGENALLILEIRGEWADLFKLIKSNFD